MMVAQTVFQNLSIEEMELLRSGREVKLGSPGSPEHVDGLLDPDITKQLLHSGGVRQQESGSYMPDGRTNLPGFMYYDEIPGATAGVSMLLRVSEFGGASLGGETSFHAKAPDGSNVGITGIFSFGSVPGPGEAPLDNARDNARSKNANGFDAELSIEPSPTTPLAEQGQNPPSRLYGTFTDMQGSYRTFPGLQPPRPFMTTDDLWQAIHEKTGKAVVADSFSRLIPLKKYKGSAFSVLSASCNDAHLHWRLDEGFLTGRSATYQWQRLNEVPKRELVRWTAIRKRNGWLPLEEVLAMSELTDRQLDSFEVGKAIAHQWHLPEWGIPSRPHMAGP
jgi:hypothetical protein